MTWSTHALLGISTRWLLAPLPPELIGYDLGTLATIAALGALLPDLDASNSKIKHLKLLGTRFKPFLLPSYIIHRSDRHRGLLHSLLGLSMVAGVAVPPIWWAGWAGWAPVVALLLGYASHLLADAATKTGIAFLFPSRKRFHALPVGLRVTTDSQAEEVLFALAVAVVFLLLLRYSAISYSV
ncbi:MAG: metal-dependent hydrolase [Armatimonadota bacterium]|nr:metal-dependent hydrolase [Armatimonadota bacterium]